MTDPDETIARPQGPQPSDLETTAPTETAAELVRVLDAYMAALQAGEAPDRAQLLADNPGLASQLEPCLAGIDFIHRAASPEGSETNPALLGEFRIIREVGRGGMGVVYEAEQTSLRRKVALKVLRFGVVADEEALRRFRVEAETVARLHHTNIVPIFAVGTEHDVSYYAMQFIDGRSLADVQEESRREGRPISSENVAQWGLQAAEALAHAHQRRVIHRDIKPSNLLIDNEGVVWLTDFGLAKRSDEVTLTLSGTLMGTPRYMSPEQAEAMKRPVDHRTDLYSLGASLYELATGRPVFESATAHGVILQVLNTEPVAPRTVRPQIPKDLETILLTCLAKDPERRYGTAQALAEDLRSYLEGRAIKARRTPIWEKMVRSARRQKKSFVVGSIAAVASVALVIGSLVFWRSHEESMLGKLSLSTNGETLTAEVLKVGTDERVGEPFTVPTRSPVALPEGDYCVRLSAPGKLSETYQLRLERWLAQDYPVDLGKRDLWASRPQEPVALFWGAYPFPVGGKNDLIEVDGFSVSRVTCYREIVWTFKVSDPTHLPAGAELGFWLNLLSPGMTSAAVMFHPGVLRSLPDLDGDGVGDVVVSSRQRPFIFALSGKDGKLLWHHSMAEAEPSKPNAWSRCAGDPLVFDGPGGPSLVTSFEMGMFGNDKGQTMRVEAIDARTGQSRWNLRFSHDVERSTPAFRLRVQGQELVGVVAGTEWSTLDPATGATIGTTVNLGQFWSDPSDASLARPIRKPLVADLDGDGSDDLLLLLAGADLNQPELVAVSGLNHRLLWKARIVAKHMLGSFDHEPEMTWPKLADLDGDGRPEVLVPYRLDNGPKFSNRRSGGLRVLDGRDGVERWSHRFQTDQNLTLSSQFEMGPDIDGDGVRDVFAASIVTDSRLIRGNITQSTLFVDALSGQDGRSLWWRSHPLLASEDHLSRPLRWWETGPDGFPKLIVDAGNNVVSLSDSPVFFTFASSTGQLLNQGFEIHPTGSADLDGDGLPELWGTTSVLIAQGMRSVRRVAISGQPPSAWKRLGRWEVGGDYDRDGVADLVGPDNTRHNEVDSISGRDGHILWATRPDQTGLMNWGGGEGSLFRHVPLPEKTGDLDGDGVPELVLARDRRNDAKIGSGFTIGLSVCSGRTGKILWENPVIPDDGRYLSWCAPCNIMALDVDGSGHSDIFALLNLQGSRLEGKTLIIFSEFHLTRFSGATGRVVSITKVATRNEGVQQNDALPLRDFANTLADLDGDGRPEIVFLLPHYLKAASQTSMFVAADEKKSEFVAVSLTDGRVRWSHVGGMTLDYSKPFDDTWSRFATGDLDGDRKSEVVLVDVTAGQVRLERWDGHSQSAPRWFWSGSDLDGGTLKNVSAIPRLAELDGLGRKSVVVIAYQEKAGSRLVVLDADGRVARSRSIVSKGLGHQLWVHDLDGDGKDEILFEDKGKLRAVRGDLATELWASPSLDKVKEFRPDAAGKPVVVLQNGIAIEGATGRIAWRSEPLWNGPLISGPDHGRPLAVSRLQGETTASFALAASETGAFLAASGKGIKTGPSEDDPRIVRPLPWVIGSPGGFREDMRRWLPWIVCVILGSGAYSFVVLVGPLRILVKLFQRKARVRDLLLLPISAAAAFSVYAFLSSNFFGSNGLNMGFPPPLAVIWAVLLAIFGLPILTYATRGFSALRSRAGRAILGWFLLWGVGCVAAAGILIYLHHRDWMAPEERYSWDGWWAIWLPGLYTAGCQLIAWKILAWPFKRLMRSRSRAT